MLADLGVPIDRRLTDSAVSGLDRRSEGESILGLSPIERRQYFKKLLKTDFRPHKTDCEKLYKICTDLQTLALEIDQRPEGKTMPEEADSTLTQSPSKVSTRIATDDSELQKGAFEGGEGIAVVFSPSDNRLTIRQLRSMRTADYTKADLPSFHWWSDTLYIYFEKRLDTTSLSDQAQVKVSKSYLSHSTENANLNFFRTIKLGQLGWGIKMRRIFGQMKVIYVLSPQSRSNRSSEMTVVNAGAR